MAPIKCQHYSTSRCRKRYDRCVFDALACLACLVRGQDVVAELTQSLDHGITEILVGVQRGHWLRFRSLLDGLVNLIAVVSIVFPGCVQIRLR